jgi:hypothetical protein
MVHKKPDLQDYDWFWLLSLYSALKDLEKSIQEMAFFWSANPEVDNLLICMPTLHIGERME